MGARDGISLMCATKSRAVTMAEFVRKGGYGARITKNTGADAKEYPWLVSRTDKLLKSKK